MSIMTNGARTGVNLNRVAVRRFDDEHSIMDLGHFDLKNEICALCRTWLARRFCTFRVVLEAVLKCAFIFS